MILASPESREARELAKSHVTGRDAVLHDWIEEAIEQIGESATPER